MKLVDMVSILKKREGIQWHTIKQAEMKIYADRWYAIRTNWQYYVISNMCPPGRFKCGGDRSSAKYKAKRALIDRVQQLTQTDDILDATVPVEDIAETIAHDVSTCFTVPSQDVHTRIRFLKSVRTLVQEVVVIKRSQADASTITSTTTTVLEQWCESYQEEVIDARTMDATRGDTTIVSKRMDNVSDDPDVHRASCLAEIDIHRVNEIASIELNKQRELVALEIERNQELSHPCIGVFTSARFDFFFCLF